MVSKNDETRIGWTVRIQAKTRRQIKVLAGMYGVTMGDLIETMIEAEYAREMQEAGQ